VYLSEILEPCRHRRFRAAGGGWTARL